MTFAAVDWGMSIEPDWFSSIYGVMLLVGQVPVGPGVDDRRRVLAVAGPAAARRLATPKRSTTSAT